MYAAASWLTRERRYVKRQQIITESECPCRTAIWVHTAQNQPEGRQESRPQRHAYWLMKECGSCKERQWVGRVKKRVSKHVKNVNTNSGAMPSYVNQLGILLTVQIGI